jgi:hypothetical protein
MTVTQLIRRVARLPRRDRRRLMEALSGTLRKPNGFHRRAEKGMRAFLAMAGSGHSDFTDVSTNKYRHLGFIKARN